LLLPAAQELPKPGRLGLELVSKNGHVIVHGFTADSPARTAGVKTEDILLAVNDQPVKTINDVRVTLWDHLPGDVMHLRVRRTVQSGKDRTATFDVTLH